jgi:hypothetical protein
VLNILVADFKEATTSLKFKGGNDETSKKRWD